MFHSHTYYYRMHCVKIHFHLRASMCILHVTDNILILFHSYNTIIQWMDSPLCCMFYFMHTYIYTLYYVHDDIELHVKRD